MEKLVNPIVKKDLRVICRSMKFSWGLFAYEAVLALAFCLTMLVIYTSSGFSSMRSNVDIYEGYVAFFPIVGVAQLCIISLIVPIITASSISGERERGTLDVLLTTTITPVQIIIGKVSSAVIRVMIFVFASIPLMAASFIMGGLSWGSLFVYIILAFVFAVMTGSIGTMCSAFCKKTIPAIIMSYVIYGIIYGGTYLPIFILSLIVDDVDDVYWMLLGQITNPVTSFVVFFVNALTGEGFNDIFSYGGNSSDILEFLFSTPVWLIISSVFQLGVAALAVLIASKKIRPGKK
ncbi:MAG: ABC transporter permease [Eubacterium sp.]|nr:ABC transporter permease [Eubacterium sp.]